jgi:two-component system, LuxR family, response regulator FixJ
MSSGPTVFIVDDDAAMRDSLRWLLQSEGLSVEAHASAEAFLETYDPTRPGGCLILDVRLPGISGLDLQDELRARGITLPVVIVTGYGEPATKSRALNAGALDFIEKPLNVELLLGRIRQAMEIDRK